MCLSLRQVVSVKDLLALIKFLLVQDNRTEVLSLPVNICFNGTSKSQLVACFANYIVCEQEATIGKMVIISEIFLLKCRFQRHTRRWCVSSLIP